jgi:transposase
MTTEASSVIGGVDTHKHTHYAAAVDQHGRLLGHQEFPATDRGYQRLLTWMRRHGQIAAIGVESTGSFGATLTRALTKAGERVVEVNRPNRLARRLDGKSDRLDAEQIARVGRRSLLRSLSRCPSVTGSISPPGAAMMSRPGRPLRRHAAMASWSARGCVVQGRDHW